MEVVFGLRELSNILLFTREGTKVIIASKTAFVKKF